MGEDPDPLLRRLGPMFLWTSPPHTFAHSAETPWGNAASATGNPAEMLTDIVRALKSPLSLDSPSWDESQPVYVFFDDMRCIKAQPRLPPENLTQKGTLWLDTRTNQGYVRTKFAWREVVLVYTAKPNERAFMRWHSRLPGQEGD
jgi:hypothetical protein